MAQHTPALSQTHLPANDPTAKKSKPITLDAFVSQVYLPYVKLRKRSWRIDERMARKHLSPAFGDRLITKIRRCEVDDWFHGLLSKGFAPVSCNRFLAVFKTICAVAEEHGFLPGGKSTCLGVASLKIHVQGERYLSREKARRLMLALEQSGHIAALSLRLILLTGARKSEILNARRDNVNIEQHLLTIPLSKSGKPRHIPLSQAAIAVIGKIPRKSSDIWLFTSEITGKAIPDIYLFWDKLRKKIGLADVRIHDLRHTFASFLVNSGHSLYEVQKMFGHGDPRMYSPML